MKALSARTSHVVRSLVLTGTIMWPTVPLTAWQPAQKTDAPAPGRQEALQDFQRRLQAYMELREALSQKLKPLAPTASAADLGARQNALAAAIRAARAGARPGAVIPQGVASQIAASIADDFKRRGPAEGRAAFTEVPGGQPAINGTYPPNAALPPIPPLLLLTLPRLPDSLQYRFYGRHLLLLDSDVQIVVDYIANVLPPH